MGIEVNGPKVAGADSILTREVSSRKNHPEGNEKALSKTREDKKRGDRWV